MANPIEVLTAAPAAVLAVHDEHAPPTRDIQAVLAGMLGDLLGVERVPADSDFFQDLGADSMVMARFCARVRRRADLPSVSIKDVYQHPTIAGLATVLAPRGASAPAPAPVSAEAAFAEVLAEVLHVERVPVDSHFFDDLGADSMVMAQFCARVRKRPDLPSVSMKLVYQHPSIGALAIATASDAVTSAAPPPASVPVSIPPPAARPRVGTPGYVLCAALQILTFLAYSYVVALVTLRGAEWISAGSGLVAEYLRALLFGAATFLGLCILPILAKWVLIGRWKPQRIRVWSLAYVRFWVVKTLVRGNPLMMFFVGSPLYVLYLRALGANIGRGVAILTKQVPICTDLLTVGEGTVIRREVVMPGYRAEAGFIEIGGVTVGKDALVSEATVLEIDTSVGDGAQLGIRSTLYRGQAVPDGEHWHGSPAVPSLVDYRVIEPADCGPRRRVVYSILQLLNLMAVTLPLAMGGVALVFFAFPRLRTLLTPGPLALTSWTFYRDALAISAVVFFGGVLLSAAVTFTVPRVLNLAIEPDRVYPLYGFHYVVHKTITRLTNRKFLTAIFGDSSYIVHYLRWLGYDLSEVVQTGSNFGTNVTHDTPYLTTVGSGTMVADGLTVINADYSSTSFRVSRVSIAPRSFLGNGVIYPPQARTGDNCLLGTKVMVPIEGPVREGVGLLGSPQFEIPRSVERDASFDYLKSAQELPGHLAAKNRYNRRTIGVFVLVRWMNFFGITTTVLAASDVFDSWGAKAFLAAELAALLFTIVYGVIIERANARFRPLTPQFCSIYDPYFWWHERYWKLLWNPAFFNGTPMKGLMWRLLGLRVGRRLFDEGCDIPERTLVTIGDDCTLNALSWLQCHSQEDGTFKSDHATLGNGCTIGLAAWTHYGVTLGEGTVLAADSFLMKGEELPAGARWGGNPAIEIRDDGAAAQLRLDRTHAPVAVTSGQPPGRHRAPVAPAVPELVPAALRTATAAPRHG